MFSAFGQFAVSAVVIIFAGTYLSRFADEIAEKTGFGRLLIGSILLAGATSLPELTVDISAVRAGMADLAMGDLMGSSLFNLLILAILDLSSNSRGKMLSRQAAGHALSGNVSAVLTAMVVLCLLAQPVSAHGEFLNISYGLWAVLLLYLFGVRLIYFDQQVSSEKVAAQSLIEEPPQHGPLWTSIAGFLTAALVIVFAGPFLSDSAGKIAELSGLGKTFVGTTLVAFSTSLPELVASLAALRMGAHDLAIGNVFGSNAFNMILFVPLDAVHAGPILSAVSPGHAVSGVAAIIATLIVVLGQLYQVERRRWLIEPDATLVMVIIFGALGVIYKLG
ncbi:sodium:calcium antiporter [bacterium]|nr:sodium:calcium antiporter [bacterium]